jgi:hypothetical protein
VRTARERRASRPAAGAALPVRVLQPHPRPPDPGTCPHRGL